MTDQCRVGGTRKPSESVMMIVPGGADGGRSQGRANCLTGRGGGMGLEVRGGARESTHQSVAGKQEDQGRSELLRGVNEGGVEGLKGASGDRAKELDSIGYETIILSN